jgi:hypothetical protein
MEPVTMPCAITKDAQNKTARERHRGVIVRRNLLGIENPPKRWEAPQLSTASLRQEYSRVVAFDSATHIPKCCAVNVLRFHEIKIQLAAKYIKAERRSIVL